MNGKNKKHQEFVNQYFLCNMNQTEAYLKVYPKSSYDSARANSARLIADDSVSAEISRRLKEKQLSVDEVLYRLAEQARGEHSVYLLPNGVVNYGAILEDGKGHLVHKVKQTKYGNEIEFYDAQAALVHIGKAHGLFNNDAGSSDDKPFIVKVVYGDRNQRTNNPPPQPPPETSAGD